MAQDERSSIDVARTQGKEGIQTSKEKVDETVTDETSKTKTDETETDENGGTKVDEANKGGEDDINPDTKKPYTSQEWKKKFSDSASGVQKLLDEINILKTNSDQSQAKEEELNKKIEELTKLAEGKNPEGLKASELQTQLSKLTQDHALLKEDKELDSFEKTVPLASTKREALKALARANPKEKLQKLWDDYLKAGAEAEAIALKKKKDDLKKGAGDKGNGTSTREMATGQTVVTDSGHDTGYSLEDFNKLPVAKRKELLAK